MKKIQIQKAIVTKHGGPSVFNYQNASLKVPSGNELQIEVHYAGINFADIMGRMGLYPTAPKPPYAPGFEISGIVTDVGNKTNETMVGKTVVGLTRFGGYSSHVNLPADEVFEINPSQLKAGAAIPVNYLTAYFMMVTQCNLQEDEWVLIHGIGGGVGIAAIQIAQKIGAKIIGTASARKHDRLKEMGIKYLIDYQTEDFQTKVMELTDGNGAQVILDPLGGKALKKSYKSLSEFGRLVSYGFSNAAPGQTKNIFKILPELIGMPKFDPMKLMMHNKGVFGFHLGMLRKRQALVKEVSKLLIQWLSDDMIDPVVDTVFPLMNVSEAHAYIGERKNFGKVLLSPLK